MTIPSRWRFQGDEADVYLALPNSARFITVFPPARIEKLEETLEKLSITDPVGLRKMTAILSNAQSFGCDRQGRVLIGQSLLEIAGIEKQCVLLGSIGSFHIYSPEVFDSLMAKTPDALTEAFKEFNL